MSEFVRIVEVGPRDGLQNEAHTVPTTVKIELINRLAEAGLRHIEATAFVSSRWVPQMGDHTEVMRGIRRTPGVTYSALVPNLKGLEAAQAAEVDEVAVFASASETFSKENINCSIAESIQRFQTVLEVAARTGMKVRGYVSCVLGCPYEGEVAPAQVVHVAARLFAAGCYEISLGDTIGIGTPQETTALMRAVADHIPIDAVAGHFHDTYGHALANVSASIECGVRTFDSSVGGLGGCPYAPGASGNVATEDVVGLMREMNMETGVDLEGLLAARTYILRELGRSAQARKER